MDNRVQLLGIAVDIASTNVASEASIQYLQEESNRTVYFLNSETLLLLQNDEEQRNIVSNSALVLPGTASVNASIDEALKNKRDPFFFESYMDAIFNYATREGKEIMLLAGSEEQYTSVKDNIHEKWSFLSLSGTFIGEQTESLENIVNEINSIAPDILILALEEKTQLDLLRDYKSQMNAGLMLFTGNILYNRALLEAKVPEPIEKLRIQNIYKWFKKGDGGKSLFNNIKMKLSIKRDNNGKSDA